MTKSVAGGFARSDAEASGGSRGTGSTSGSHAFLSRVRAFSTRGRLWLDDSDKPREEPSAGKPHARICGGEAEWPSYPTTSRTLTKHRLNRLVEEAIIDAYGESEQC